jgi:hypothetical protein
VVLETTEIFHPKLYLFRHQGTTSLLAGSSNLTDGGFQRNREANVLLTTAEGRSGPVADAAAYIEARYREASEPRGRQWKSWLKKYRSSWKKKPRPPVGPYAGGARRDLNELEVWSFAEYFHRLRQGNRVEGIPLGDWLNVLETIRAEWNKAGWKLQGMPIKYRRILAGEHHADADGSGLFGFVGLGHFLHTAINDPAKIDRALRMIPRQGPVQDSDWTKFYTAYSRAFHKAAVGTASRLLAFWRPDKFFSANRGSIPEIAKRSGFPRATLHDWAGYWEATKWIAQRPWVRTGAPKTVLEKQCWEGRVALLDVLMYRRAP